MYGHPILSLTTLWKNVSALTESYDVAKNNIVLFIWSNAKCLRRLSFKKHIIFHAPYIIVAPQCPAYLKRVDFSKL